jgi:hypothetical protein
MAIVTLRTRANKQVQVENFGTVSIAYLPSNYPNSRDFAKFNGGNLFKRHEIVGGLDVHPEMKPKLEKQTMWLEDQTVIYFSGIDFWEGRSYLNNGDNQWGVASIIIYKNIDYEPNRMQVIPAKLRKEALEELAILRGSGDHNLNAITKIVEGH